jgi:hypothetical protein
MWYLHQSVALLGAVPPPAIPSSDRLAARASGEARLQARLDCRDPAAGLGEWRIATRATLAPIDGAAPASANAVLNGPFNASSNASLNGPSSRDADWLTLPPTVSTMRFVGPVPTDADARPVEAYVRGADLVVDYGENADGDRCELYYRALDVPVPSLAGEVREVRERHFDRVYGGIELWVSVQTRKLDSRPRVRVGNRFPAGTQVLRVPDWPDPGLQVFRPPGIQVSYVESVYPSDVADLAAAARVVDDNDNDNSGGNSPRGNEWVDTVATWTGLNVEWMEKGVIRRCRVRGWWVMRDGDLAAAADLTRAFLADAPPLTA